MVNWIAAGSYAPLGFVPLVYEWCVGLAFLATWKKVRLWALPTERARVSFEAYRSVMLSIRLIIASTAGLAL